MITVISSIVTDEIELKNFNGETIKTIPFTVDLTKSADAVMALRLKLADLQASEVKDFDKIGEVTRELFTSVFGEEAMASLTEHYGDNHLALLADFTPVIVEEIFPRFDQLRQKNLNLKKQVKRK